MKAMGIFRRGLDFVMDILETVTFVASIFVVIYLFIMQPNQVKGASMEPTLHTNDYIFTSKITYRFRPIQRGDIVVFKSPKNQDIEFIKRVIGLPGDQVEIINGELLVNDQVVNEDYIAAKTALFEGNYVQDGIPIVVPDGYIFVMGDNRPNSSDSREFGPIPISSIIGQVFYRYYPPQKVGNISNPLLENLKSGLNTLLSFASK